MNHFARFFIPQRRLVRHGLMFAVTSIYLTLAIDAQPANAETIVWNVQQKFGITAAGLQQGIEEAKTHFESNPDDTVVLEIDAGKFELKGASDRKGTLVLGGVKPGENGRLVFRGKGMDETVLVFDDAKHGLYGMDVNRITFSDMHMTRDRLTISQGRVQSVAPGLVVLKIDDGFPSPQDIFDETNEVGRYLRRYKLIDDEPQIDEENNQQLAWKTATDLGQNVCELKLNRPAFTPPYQPGDLLGIKSKCGGSVFWIAGGNDLRFERVKWTLKTRGKLRQGFQKFEMIDCVTERTKVNGQWPCLASPEGGPHLAIWRWPSDRLTDFGLPFLRLRR